jgi:hypothetical protein
VLFDSGTMNRMILFSKERWKEFSQRLLPILHRLECALATHGPNYSEEVRKLAQKAQEDPQQFVFDVYDGFLWGGMGSLMDGASHPDTMQALLDLAEALKSEGLDTDRTNSAAASLRADLKVKRKK